MGQLNIKDETLIAEAKELAALLGTSTTAALREAVHTRLEREKALASRPFLDVLYAPRAFVPGDATLICRCEEVSAGQIREAAARGCQGLNQLKAFTRCGMGPCQGRMCGATAAEVLARARGVHAREIEPLHTRFPARPLTVGQLAEL